MRTKKHYESPHSAVLRVQLETPICGGSVDIANPSDPKLGAIEEQSINNDFSSDAFTGGDWTTPQN